MATVKAVTVYKLENENEEPRCLGRMPYCGDDHLRGFRAFLEGNKENPIFPWPFDFWDSQARTRIAAELEQYNTLELHGHAVFFIRSHGQQFSIAGKDILEPGTSSEPHAAAEAEQKDTSPFIASSSTTGTAACAPNSSLRENDSHEEPSCPTLQPRHKIFLSHSGTQKNFVAKLCKYLEAHNVYPFFDQRSDSLPKGKKFSTLILDAARKCRVAVVVLSEEYLSSKWPMLELAEFVRARRSENKNLNLLPLFYKASVGDLSDESIKNKWRPRWMKLVGSGDARVDLEDWTRALHVLRGINGPSFDKFGNSKESYRDAVVKEIFRLAPPDLLYDTSKIFGWSRICKILAGMFLLHTKTSAQVLGLYGMGGLGKSTMSTSLCNYFNQEFLGRVCYIEINEESTPRERQQMVMRKLLRLDDLLLQSVSKVSQGWELLRTRMKEHPVLLVIDNVQPDQQSKEEALEYLSVEYSSGSKIMVTSRSSEVVEDVLGDPRYCHEIPCLTREEAAGVFLQQGAPQMNHSSLTSDESRVVESCLEEAWFSQGSQPSEQINIICDHEASISKAGHYHPLALRALGAYFHDRSKTSDLLSWGTYLHEYAQLKGTRESYTHMFNILGLQFNTLDRMTQLMFLDITLYGSKALETPILSNSQLEEFVAWLSDIHGVATEVVRFKIFDFKRFAMINIDGERIIVHDLYKEYATWFLEHVNFKEVTGVWCVSKHGESKSSRLSHQLEHRSPGSCLLERLIERRRMQLESIYCNLLLQVRQTLSGRCVELERTPPGGCWPELRRIRLENIRCDGFSMSGKVQEWCNVVVLQIDGCNKLTTLDLQGLSCLRHLELKRLRSLKTLLLIQTFPSLQFVTIASLDSIQFLPSFSPFTSLKFLKVVDCKGLIQPPSVQHCSSLKRLWLSWYPRQEFLPNLEGLTSLRDLTIECGYDSLSYEGRALKLEGLNSLTSLGALELRSIPVEELSGLESLTCVEYIHLDDMRYLTTLASLFNLARSSLIVLEVWGLKSSWPKTEEELDELQSLLNHKLQGLVAGVEVHVPDTPCKILEWHRRDVLEHPVVNAFQNACFSNAMFGRVSCTREKNVILTRSDMGSSNSLVALLNNPQLLNFQAGGGLEDAIVGVGVGGSKRPGDFQCYGATFEGEGEGGDDGELGETGLGGGPVEKKRRLSFDQVRSLERNFEMENQLEPERKMQLAKELGLQPRQVAVWFQNRRARWKTKQLERDYEMLNSGYLKLKADFETALKEKDVLKAEVQRLSGKGGDSAGTQSLDSGSSQCESADDLQNNNNNNNKETTTTSSEAGSRNSSSELLDADSPSPRTADSNHLQLPSDHPIYDFTAPQPADDDDEDAIVAAVKEPHGVLPWWDWA